MNINFTPPGNKALLATAGVPYYQIIEINEGRIPYDVIIQGRLPGIRFSVFDSSITLDGTPKIMGIFTFTLVVTDSNKHSKTQSYTIKISLDKLANDLEELRENAIALKNRYSSYEHELLYYNFKTARFNLVQITDPPTYDLIESIIEGLYNIVDSEFIRLDDSLEILITTLPPTIRFIRNMV